MIKEFFTLGEAASFLSSSDQVPVSGDDLLRLCEVQKLPISFKYRGYLGAFTTYSGKPDSAKLFPTPSRQVSSYWNGSIPWASVKDFTNDDSVISSTQESITVQGLRCVD